MRFVLSIIMPCYNVADFLDRAFNSVLQQTMTSWELIIIDDGSTDNTWEKCKAYSEKDSRVKILRQKNRGQGAARNFALQTVRGEYVTFIDADDAFLDYNTFEVAIAYLDSHNEVDVVQFPYVRFNKRGIIVPPKKLNAVLSSKKDFIESTDIVNSVAETPILLKTAPWGKIFRSVLFREVRFPEGMVYEDTFMFCELFEITNRIAVIDKGLYGNYERDGSTTNSRPSAKKMQDKIKAFCRIHQSLYRYSDDAVKKRSFTLWLLKLVASFKGMFGKEFDVSEDIANLSKTENFAYDRKMIYLNRIGFNRVIRLLSVYYSAKWTISSPR